MATILVVDDVAANRQVLVALLGPQGHRFVEAADGSAGLAAARAEHPDLVITDVLMPIMDGYEFVRHLRLDDATRSIPVVFYTAHYGEREARELARSSGVTHVLAKPVEPDEVLTIVRRVLAGESATDIPNAPLPTEFDREHLRLVTDKVSEQAGDLRAANARLRALINIGLELASERDADRALDIVCAAARDLFSATYVTLGIVDPAAGRLRRYVSHGLDGPGWIADGDAVPPILHAAIVERRTLRADNPGGDPVRLGLPATHPMICGFLSAPVASPGQVYGWLCLVRNEGDAFTEEDEQLITALSGQVGRIYENGYLYAVARKRADDLEHEIAERQRAEGALRQARDRAERYLDTAEVILLALDRDGRITLVNRYACALLGWTAEELLGRSWVDMCLPARIRGTVGHTLQNMLAGDLSVIENLVVTRSGDERLIEWRNTLLKDEAQCVVGSLSSGTDITERSQAIEALRTAEERMRFALQSADVGIWDMDYTTGSLRWSETLESHYGLAPGTFEGTFEAFVQRVHPDDRESMQASVAAAIAAGSDFTVQHRSVRPDGEVRWLTGAGRIILDDRGLPVRGIGISLDVTERRLLEEQYQQAQKMEAIGRLAGGVAHDFNNLLSEILGHCELLLTDFDTTDPRYADIGEIQQAGMRAAGLTRQLLAFSRKQIIEPKLIDVSAVVADMRAMLTRLIGEDVKVEIRLQPNLSAVTADRGQVEQVVMNLAVNARDAMPAGGTLRIETADVVLGEECGRTHSPVKPGAYVKLTVTDTGSGMTPQVQARVFEPFFTTKEPGKGTGLGLATIHAVVTRSGGSVRVHSEVGKGTAFEVYFPRAEAGAVAAETPQAPAVAVAPGTHTVLVVEDMMGLRDLAKRLLERLGYTVFVAANAEEALATFERHPSIDVLLTDVVMPGASGPELTRQLVRQRPALKVIYMSGYTEDAIVHHGVIEPGIAFLNKPFTSEALGRKIRDVVGEGAARRRSGDCES